MSFDRPRILLVLLPALALAFYACDGRSAGTNTNNDNNGNTTGNTNGNSCEDECDPLSAPSDCIASTQVRYCQELVHCGPDYPGQWRLVTCESTCENGITSVADATELVFDHCGTEQTTVTDGEGSCWCRNPHTDTLHLVHPMFGTWP